MSSLQLARRLKGEAKPKGKANVKDKAYGQGQAQPQDPVSSSGAGSNGSNGWNCIQPSHPMGKLGSQTVKYQTQALVASDPENNPPLLKHYAGLTKYSDKLKFALQRKIGRTDNFMTAS